MSDLTFTEKLKLEDFFGMGSGYVLDFSDRTFQEFILEYTGIDIYEDRYNYASGSKANRLRAFWTKEPNNIVGKLIFGLLEYWETQIQIQGRLINSDESLMANECYKIAERLVEQNEQNTEDGIEINAHFEQIQKNIIEQLKLAKFTVWVAVAWFTDRVLFDCLMANKQQGVNVQLIIVDDEINENSGLNYEKEFETYRIKKVGNYENLMHHKFCIIDLKKVISGSYNWTNKARYNNEDITITDSREVAEKFSAKFIELKKTVVFPNQQPNNAN
jgi:phosphatidylserine/phosphatidylglycerophosphate/cardiolipin synthase-like enzyme